MGFMQRMRAQAGNPTGFLGVVMGIIMAHRRSNKERTLWTISLLDLQRNDRVLEIGFGPGVAIHEASKIVLDGLVVGIDHSTTMVRQARKRNTKGIQDGRVELILASVSSLPEFSEPFDKILAINSMMFWKEPVTVLRDLWRMLKPGGRIAITHQPRSPGATDADAREKGDEMVAALMEAGYSQVKLETNRMKPVYAVCATGFK